MTRRIYLFDTTLRDGAQTAGLNLTVNDKRVIARLLDDFGFDYVEGGWPGANPVDNLFFETSPALKKARFTAFGMTRRPGHSAENDPGLSNLLDQDTAATCLVGKAAISQVRDALKIEWAENLTMIGDSIARVVASGREALFDAEHFFDGFKEDEEAALASLAAAHEAGARWLVLCDTNGGTMPHEVHEITRRVTERFPAETIGIHAHNDTGQAIANSIAAVEAGACQVQGTINGLGERCGNADLIPLMANLVLKLKLDIGMHEDQLKGLKELSQTVYKRINRNPDPHAPYVGDRAFAHKGGLHASAVARAPSLYEHVPPEIVGNRRMIVMSDQAGRSNLVMRLQEIGIEVENDRQVDRILRSVKEQESLGFMYDGADASFELLVRRSLDQMPSYFEITRFRVIDDRRINALGRLVTESEATVILMVQGEEKTCVSFGSGPVNALDLALRSVLNEAFPKLKGMFLLDYHVSILVPDQEGAGSNAVTRVIIKSSDGNGQEFSTVGVSVNIIDASLQALEDSYHFRLMQAHKEYK